MKCDMDVPRAAIVSHIWLISSSVSKSLVIWSTSVSEHVFFFFYNDTHQFYTVLFLTHGNIKSQTGLRVYCKIATTLHDAIAK